MSANPASTTSSGAKGQGGPRPPVADSFGLRLGLVMTLALLPVGVMGMVQSAGLVSEARARSEAALTGETLRAVRPQMNRIEQSLGAVAMLTGLDPATCAKGLPPAMAAPDRTLFVGLYDPVGRLLCGAGGAPPHLPVPEAGEAATVTVLRQGGADPVILATAPLSGAGGFAAIAPLTPGFADTLSPDVALVLFDAAGRVLAASAGTFPDALPSNRDLAALVGDGHDSFAARSAAGPDRAYARVELVKDRLYAIGSWPVRAASLGDPVGVPVAFFPALMWTTSLIAAWIAAETLVTGHIRRLRDAITAFAGGNRRVEALDLHAAPPEIRETAHAFETMTRTILQDEARLEDSLRQKEALLREVHHRVKNNLQLIASVVNIQLRRTRSDEVRHALTSLQDRMLGIATIHDRIYQALDLSEVSVHWLFPSIVDQILRRVGARDMGLRVETCFDEMDLPLDKAVPLALLLTEAVSNAVRHAESVDGAPPLMRVVFRRGQGAEVGIEITNSATRPIPSGLAGDPGGGIGTHLLRGFVGQLGGNFDRSFSDGLCRVSIWLTLDGPVAAQAQKPLQA